MSEHQKNSLAGGKLLRVVDEDKRGYTIGEDGLTMISPIISKMEKDGATHFVHRLYFREIENICCRVGQEIVVSYVDREDGKRKRWISPGRAVEIQEHNVDLLRMFML